MEQRIIKWIIKWSEMVRNCHSWVYGVHGHPKFWRPPGQTYWWWWESHTLAQNIWSIELLSPQQQVDSEHKHPPNMNMQNLELLSKHAHFDLVRTGNRIIHLTSTACPAAFPLPLALPFALPFPALPQISMISGCEVLLGMTANDRLCRGVSNI